jgi:hypothetical protein
VAIVETATPPGQEKTLKELGDRKNSLERKLKRARIYQSTALLIFVGILIGAPIFVLSSDSESVLNPAIAHQMRLTLGGTFAAYGAMSLTAFLLARSSRLRMESEFLDISFEQELSGYRITKSEIRAERLFRRNERELLKYYSLNLIQNRIILFVGLGCILTSIIIVIVTIYIVSAEASDAGKDDVTRES